MEDKRLMDNKVVKNPLLSGVNQSSFLQEFVQGSLLVPAALPKDIQSTVDAGKSRQEKSVEKESVTYENKSQPAILPTSSPSSVTSFGRATDINPQIIQPVLLPPSQPASIPQLVNPSTLNEVPLNQSVSATSLSNQSSIETNSAAFPPKPAGPPPLTSYNRPANRLASTRYPTASFLQTVPSAQYFPQSTPSTPSVSPSNSVNNFPKSHSTSSVTYFNPQQQTSLPTGNSETTASLPSVSPISQIAQTDFKIQHSTSSIFNLASYNPFSTSTNIAPSAPPSNQTSQPTLQVQSLSASAPPSNQTSPPTLPVQPLSVQKTQTSVLTPVNVSSFPLSTNTTPQCQTSNVLSIAAPVSQNFSSRPVLIPTSQNLSPNTVVNPLSQSSIAYISQVPKTFPNSSQSLSSVNTTRVDSSSVLRSASSSPLLSPLLNAKPDQSSASVPSPVLCTPAVLEPSVAESTNSLVGNIIANVSTSHSDNTAALIAKQRASPLSSYIVSQTEQSFVPTIAAAVTNAAKTNVTDCLDSSKPTEVLNSANTSASVSFLLPSTKVSSQDSTNTVLSNITPSTSAITSSLSSSYFQPIPVQLNDASSAQNIKTVHPASSTEALSDTKHFQPISSPLPIINNSISTVDTTVTPKIIAAFPNSKLVDKSSPSNQPLIGANQILCTSSEVFPGKCSVSESSVKKSNVPVLNLIASPQTTSVTGPIQIPSLSLAPSIPPQAEPSFFTFTTTSTPSGFPDNLSHPPKQSVLSSSLISANFTLPNNNNDSIFISNSEISQSFVSSSTTQLHPPTTDTLLPQKQSITKSEFPAVPVLNPITFFSSPPTTSTSEASSTQLSNCSLLSPTTGNFTPLPPRKFNTPGSPLPVSTHTPPTPPVINKETKNVSTLTTSDSSSAPPSLTPPPPYSSLSFESKATTETLHNESSAAAIAQISSDGASVASSQGAGIVNEEELDQIPLDGSTVPLYNPLSIGASYHQTPTLTTKGLGNSYRMGNGLKRPSYAPVPDLGIIHPVHRTSPTIATMSGQTPINVTTSVTLSSPSVTPSSSVASSPPSESALFNYAVIAQGQIYRPAYHHWFYKKGGETKAIWLPFTMADSLNLEQVFTSPDLTENTKVATDGGRYDVEIVRRRKIAVYWEEPPGEVRRCSWFVRAPVESRYIPYDENIAEILEDSYKTGCLKNEWNRRVELADGEVIILHSPNAMAHHQRSSSPDTWGNPPTMQQKPRIVKRGLEDFEISEGEPNQVDHLLLMVHGIGKVCDLRFRSLVQVVDDFRCVSLQLVQSHFRSGTENGNVGRVEVLPVEWHRALHTETIDKRLADITLPSIPKAREFTNDVLLDILFYTSPVFCERIVQAVGAELNRVYNLYMTRNPGFRGGVSLGGHSLGSLILFDMLCHQKPQRYMKSSFSPQSSIPESDEDMPEVGCLKAKARLNRRMSYLTIGTAGTGQPYIAYPQLSFQPKAFFALGSPIGMFLTVRGLEGLGEDFKFPTCPKFFNIFHPNDPVAYRIEALVSQKMIGIPAVVIPHHKGRKRMHLELKDTMAHVTAALKQKLIDSMRSTWNTVYQLAMFHRPDGSIQQEVDKVIENEILTNTECESTTSSQYLLTEQEALEMKVGCLNGGNRIDYVLQEAPLETFNQYISAVRSHVVYWESEDTMLLILKELYSTMGISPDYQVPQPILPFDISSDTNETYSEYTDSIGAPPTQFTRK